MGRRARGAAAAAAVLAGTALVGTALAGTAAAAPGARAVQAAPGGSAAVAAPAGDQTAAAVLRVTGHRVRIATYDQFRWQTARWAAIPGAPAAVRARANSALAAFADPAAALREARAQTGPAGTGVYVSGVRQHACARGYLCVVRSFYGRFPGGADSFGGLETLVLDRSTGRVVPQSRFVPASALADVAAQVDARLEAAGVELFAPVTPAQVRTAAWLPGDDTLGLWFGRGDVAPNSYGTVGVRLAWVLPR